MVQNFLKKLGLNYLSLDLRSVALARVLVGLVLICDWFYRFASAYDFYTDAGVVPRAQAITDFTNPYHFSILFMAGKPIYIYAIFLLGLIFYLGFTFGYKTKINNILSWVFFVSLSARTSIVTHGGDDLIRLFLFWMIFIPSHRFYSIDRLTAKIDIKTPDADSVLSIAGIALVCQLAMMYTITAVLKNHPVWNVDRSAVYYTLELDLFLTWFGEIFRQLPYPVLQLLTYFTFYAELVVPLFLFIPWKNSYFRVIAMTVFIGFHFTLFAVLNLGNFPWICMAYWLVLTPSGFWNYLTEKLKKLQTNTIIYYDPECKICRKACVFLQSFLILKFVELRAGHEDSVLKLIRQNNSWVVETVDHRKLYRFDAFVYLVSVSPFGFLTILLQTAAVKYIGQKVYVLISGNRRKYLSALNFFKPTRNPDLSHVVIQSVVLFLFVIALLWNLTTLKKDDAIVLPKRIEIIGSYFRLNQLWKMFAPIPTLQDGWMITDGELLNGKKWDILNHRPVDYSRPGSISGMYKNTIWRKYFMNIQQTKHASYRLYLGKYLCREWNNNHSGSEQIKNFKIYYLLEESKPHGQIKSAITNQLLWSHKCF